MSSLLYQKQKKFFNLCSSRAKNHRKRDGIRAVNIEQSLAVVVLVVLAADLPRTSHPQIGPLTAKYSNPPTRAWQCSCKLQVTCVIGRRGHR